MGDLGSPRNSPDWPPYWAGLENPACSEYALVWEGTKVRPDLWVRTRSKEEHGVLRILFWRFYILTSSHYGAKSCDFTSGKSEL